MRLAEILLLTEELSLTVEFVSLGLGDQVYVRDDCYSSQSVTEESGGYSPGWDVGDAGAHLQSVFQS